MKKPISYNLYVRLDSMEDTLNHAKIDLERNEGIADILEHVDNEKKTRYNINEFVATIHTQCESIRKQIETLEEMIADTKVVISTYERNKGEYEGIVSKLLKSFGFEEVEGNKNR